jgi:DNA-directed RNA polymerase subunit alpha
MSQFFISCKESRIENNRSFYGCFYLGPFEPSQSITIANTLRRTLLSEIYGLGIVSVEIDGASHEYSSLPGVRDSILDILLNLKEIILKKTTRNFKPQIGYLRVRGPGVVRASHLRLPPNIQLVDPNQYIATLAENGFKSKIYYSIRQ